jgi:hypothetical protein
MEKILGLKSLSGTPCCGGREAGSGGTGVYLLESGGVVG